MKPLLFTLLLLFLGSISVCGQRFVGGANAGLPVGDAGDLTTFVIAVELGYLFDPIDEVEVGPKAEYKHFFGDSDIFDQDFSFLPVGATARYNVADALQVGTDVGYAVALSDFADGGFWYQPFALYRVGTVGLKFTYSGIREGAGFTLSSVNVGAEARF